MLRTYRGSALRYGVAAGSIALAIWIRLLLDPVLGIQIPYITLFFAVLFAAWYGGFGPALMAAALASLLSAYFLLPPRGSFDVQGWDQQMGMVLYIATSFGIAVLGGAMRAVQQRAERAKETERLQRERLHVTLKAIGDAVIATDTAGRVTYLNPAAEGLTGWSQAEAQGEKLGAIFRIVNEQTRRPVEDSVKKVLREGQVVGLANHTILIARDGSERPIDNRAAPIMDERAQLQGVILVFRDIGERRRAEQALLEAQRELENRVSERTAELLQANEFLKALLENVQTGVVACDAEGMLTLFNGVTRALHGLPEEPIPPEQWAGRYRLFLPDGQTPMARDDVPLYRALQGERVQDVEMVIASDDSPPRTVITSGQAFYDAQGKKLGAVVSMQEVTAQKQAERALRQAYDELERRVEERTEELRHANAALRDKEAHLRAIFEGSLDSIVMTDDEGRYMEANPGAGELFGLRRDELVGRRVSDFAEPGFPFERAWQVFRENGHSKGDFRLVRPDGTVKDVEFSATANILPGRHLSILRDVTYRKKAERALREAEARFAAVINHSPSCIFVKDRRGRYSLGNRALAQMVECKLDDFLGRTDADYFPPEVAARFAADDAEILQDGRPRIFEETFTHRGKTVTALTVKFPLLDADGTAYGVCGIATDVTEQKRAGAVLAASEERLRLALEAGRMGVWDWNIRTNELNWSDSLEPLHGLAPGTFAGTFEAFQKLIHPDDRTLVNDAIQRAVEQASGYDIEFRNVWPGGSIHWIAGKGKVFAGDDGKPARMIGIGMDVTKRKRSEQTSRFLADASATLAAVLDFNSTLQKVASLAVPYFADWAAVDLAETDGSVRRVAVAHVDPAKVELAREVHRRFPPDPAASQGLWHILRTGQSEIVPAITDELLAQSSKDQELLAILRKLGLKSYIGVPLKVRGKTLGVITFIAAESGHVYDDTDLAVAQDLANRAAVAIENTQLYRELQETGRRKDEFLATLAHELRNPLAPIRNSLQILKLPRLDAATAERSREMMERQVHHLVRLVDDLLDVSRVMRGKIELRKEPVEMASIIARAVETVQPLIESQAHTLTVTLPPESLLLDADPVRLAQVVGNLLTNAAKYTERNGRIWLEARRVGDEVTLQVRDNGIGIAPNMLSCIFDLFVQVDHAATRSQGGLGIGLTLVKNLVEIHQGTIEARSAGLGKGSEFVVRLPLSTQKHSRPERSEPSRQDGTEPQARPGHLLLVVDDNRDAAESLAMLLRLQGHEVQVAYDGPGALEVTKDYHPEMVFLDIGMPGMDGYEVARRLRQQPGLENVKLVALTGWGQVEDRRRSKEAGFDYHRVKPPEPTALDELLATLEPRKE